MHNFILALLLLGSTAAFADSNVPSSPSPSPLDAAFNRLYNHDFAGSQQMLERYTTARPQDPLGFAVKGAAYLYSELSRLNVLGKEFLTDDQKIAETKGLKPDPVVRQKFYEATERAQVLGKAALQADPNDRNALLALCLAAGVQRDFTALVEKKLRISLNYAKDAQTYAVRLLKVDPAAYDAYLTTGFSEYLLGNLPFFVKWFVKFDDVQGSKEQGLKNLEVVAKSGHYMKPFAQLLLAMFYLREKQPQRSEQLLTELAHDYPENPMIRTELARLQKAR